MDEQKKPKRRSTSVEHDRGDASQKVRAAFPEACKWFERSGVPTSEQATKEVKERFRRSEGGASPCDNCPLCPGHH